MTRWFSFWVAALLLPVSLAACGDTAAGERAGSGEGGSVEEPSCEGNADCEWAECPCANGGNAVGGICETTGDSETGTCVSAAELCASIGCPLDGSSTGGTGGGAAASGASGSTAASTGSGEDASSSSGSDPPTHPECLAYADGNCDCTYTGECPPDQYDELVSFCESFFDTEYMQCVIACATGGGECSAKSECVYACDE